MQQQSLLSKKKSRPSASQCDVSAGLSKLLHAAPTLGGWRPKLLAFATPAMQSPAVQL